MAYPLCYFGQLICGNDRRTGAISGSWQRMQTVRSPPQKTPAFFACENGGFTCAISGSWQRMQTVRSHPQKTPAFFACENGGFTGGIGRKRFAMACGQDLFGCYEERKSTLYCCKHAKVTTLTSRATHAPGCRWLVALHRSPVHSLQDLSLAGKATAVITSKMVCMFSHAPFAPQPAEVVDDFPAVHPKRTR